MHLLERAYEYLRCFTAYSYSEGINGMQPTRVLRKKWFAGGCSAAALAGIWFGTAVFRPSVSKAITAVEMPAFVFPEVTAQSNENLMLCTNNLLGDGSVRVLIGLLDVADSTHFVAGTTFLNTSLDRQKGGCSLLLPAVHPTAGTLAPPPARTGIPVIFVVGPGVSAAGGGGGAGRGLLSSVQLVEADGSVRLVMSPTLMDRVGLPAVQ